MPFNMWGLKLAKIHVKNSLYSLLYLKDSNVLEQFFIVNCHVPNPQHLIIKDAFLVNIKLTFMLFLYYDQLDVLILSTINVLYITYFLSF